MYFSKEKPLRKYMFRRNTDTVSMLRLKSSFIIFVLKYIETTSNFKKHFHTQRKMLHEKIKSNERIL